MLRADIAVASRIRSMWRTTRNLLSVVLEGLSLVATAGIHTTKATPDLRHNTLSNSSSMDQGIAAPMGTDNMVINIS